MVRVFALGLTFAEYEERRVHWGKAYKAEKGEITQDAVNAAFNRAIKQSFSDKGGYTKPKAEGESAKKAAARSETDIAAQVIASSAKSEEELQAERDAVLAAKQALEKAALSAKGAEKKQAQKDLNNAKVTLKVQNRALAMREKANKGANKERRDALLEIIREFIKEADVQALERIASECHD